MVLSWFGHYKVGMAPGTEFCLPLHLKHLLFHYLCTWPLGSSDQLALSVFVLNCRCGSHQLCFSYPPIDSHCSIRLMTKLACRIVLVCARPDGVGQTPTRRSSFLFLGVLFISIQSNSNHMNPAWLVKLFVQHDECSCRVEKWSALLSAYIIALWVSTGQALMTLYAIMPRYS